MRLRTAVLLISAALVTFGVGFCSGVSAVGGLSVVTKAWTSAKPQPTAASDPTLRYRVTLLETMENLGSVEPTSPARQGVFLAKLSPESMTATGFEADWLSTSFTEISPAINASSYRQQVPFYPVGAQLYVLTPERPGKTLRTPHPIISRDFVSTWNDVSADSLQLRESYWWVVLSNGRCYALMQAPGYSQSAE